MSTAYGIHQFYNKKFKTLEFTGKWEEFVGKPELSGSWFIWGNSSNGKTSFAAQLSKYLGRFHKVAYNSLEEGLSVSLKKAFQTADITPDDNVMLLDKEPIPELAERLRKHKSPNIIIVDSFQYSRLNALTYKKLIDEFDKKLFVFISHADGKQPSGRSAKTVHFDANVKIWVEGFKAFPNSRYGGGEPLVIWNKGAAEYWME
ncbi:MAG: hypothetical protein U9N85_01235 [Bacteroidota bacterium]|nr:hypothetical protein [Bacteroidota bacterium]